MGKEKENPLHHRKAAFLNHYAGFRFPSHRGKWRLTLKRISSTSDLADSRAFSANIQLTPSKAMSDYKNRLPFVQQVKNNESNLRQLTAGYYQYYCGY